MSDNSKNKIYKGIGLISGIIIIIYFRQEIFQYVTLLLHIFSLSYCFSYCNKK